MTCFWPFWMNVSKMEYKCPAAAQRNSSQNWCENLSGLGIPFNSLRSRTSMLFSTFWWILSCCSILAWNACAILAVACVCWLADSSSACWSCCCPWVSCSVICISACWYLLVVCLLACLLLVHFASAICGLAWTEAVRQRHSQLLTLDLRTPAPLPCKDHLGSYRRN